MNYNPFSITNLYDTKNNRNQLNNAAGTQNTGGNSYLNRDASPHVISNMNTSGYQAGSNGQSSSNNYYTQQQSPISNTAATGYSYQTNSYQTQQDYSAPRQANSPMSHAMSNQVQKVSGSTPNHQQHIQNQYSAPLAGNGAGSTPNGMSQQQNHFNQAKSLNSNINQVNFQSGYAYQQNGNHSALAQSREKSPIGMNNGSNNSTYNLNSNAQQNQPLKKISSGGIQIFNDSSTKQPQQAVKGSLSPLNRFGYQSKYSNINFTNYSQSKLGNNPNQNGLYNNNEDKNKQINQSQQFGNASPLVHNYSQQAVNQSVQGPLTNGNVSHSPYHGSSQQNNQQNGLGMQYSSNLNSSSQPKEVKYGSNINNGGLKSARNVKEQIKQIGNAISTTPASSKNIQNAQMQRVFKSNEGIEENQSSTRLATSPMANTSSYSKPLGYGNNSSNTNYNRGPNDSSPMNKTASYNSSYRQQTPPLSHANNPVPAQIPSNLFMNFNGNQDQKKMQHSNHQALSSETPLSNKTNEYAMNGKKENGYNQFQSDQKQSYQYMSMNNGMNKSASNSRNISPQNISVNLSTSNLSNSHTPRTQSKNNSQSGMPISVTQQLFSKKLQEQRTVHQNYLTPQPAVPVQSVNINQLSAQTPPIKASQPTSSSNLQTSPAVPAVPVNQNQSQLSNQSSTQNLNAQLPSSINGSGQKVTFNLMQSNPSLKNQQSLMSETSIQNHANPSQQNNVNSSATAQRIQTLPSDSKLNTSQNLETEVFEQQQTTLDIHATNQNQNFQSWWAEKRNTNLQFIQGAKLNNHSECISYLDKKRGEMKAEINYKDEDQNTALHYAAQNGNGQLVNFLLYNEANIDSQNKNLVTPLMFACIEGHEDVCQILITAGADINNCDNKENTALHYASINGHKKIVDILLRKPSLFYKKKNINNQEASQLASNDDVKKAFENFFSLQKQLLQSQQKLQIHDAQPQNVQQMFQKLPNNNPDIQVENKSNGVYKKSSENDNKSSINEKNSTSDESKSSFGAQEERVGPNDFIVHGLIGKGSFGEVYLVEKKGSQMLYAMKVLHKSKIIRHNLTKYAMTERNVMSLTNHPFIVKLNYAFQTSDKLFLIMDYCPGGDLGEHLQKEKKFSEELVRMYLAETILALEDLHKRDVIFRDLKPDNIVLDYEGHVKLTDFGLSKEGVLDHSSGARSFCGSVAYLAPEMLKRCGHGKAVDWYLLGVVMYELLVGIPPYYANNRDELFYNIEKAPLKIPSYLSTEARSLLKALLQRNPAKRLGSGKGDAEEIKVHPFFQEVDWNSVFQRKLKPPRPNRKIRISTKFDPNLFAETDYKGDKDYIAGWSFVSP